MIEKNVFIWICKSILKRYLCINGRIRDYGRAVATDIVISRLLVFLHKIFESRFIKK